jgi:hypothetical protein
MLFKGGKNVTNDIIARVCVFILVPPNPDLPGREIVTGWRRKKGITFHRRRPGFLPEPTD